MWDIRIITAMLISPILKCVITGSRSITSSGPATSEQTPQPTSQLTTQSSSTQTPRSIRPPEKGCKDSFLWCDCPRSEPKISGRFKGYALSFLLMRT
ncbi:hypothetical protein KIN20_012730 [Parelaphostrongylus tenuis]|uniref:Secreted protein n=1 Tax=Parelaphostrongylus tenuis TaxID=148309 RepID=A0AAD5MFL5_PARTN|nr:hypothetical protein KIN20_012730 [Parelaphostrongylus tenuis]